MPKSLKDQVVFITGASSGFGADSARLFAREGCRVVLTARRMDRLQAVAEEIVGAGGQALPLPLDVTDQMQIGVIVQHVLDAYGQIDVLFNNAGFGYLDWLESLDPLDNIDVQLEVNLRAVIQVTRAVLPHMLARSSGHIINMSSMAGWIAPPLYSIYSATKFGVRGFTESLRREVAPLGVHVSGIYPGGASTEFGQHAGRSIARRAVKTPAWILMTSEYVARRVVDLVRHPRRTLIIPWWMVPLVWFNTCFPALSDWIQIQFSKRFHRL